MKLFYKKKGGYHARCKTCYVTKSKEYREKNKSKLDEARKSPERIEYLKKWRLENREKVLKNEAKWRRKNLEKIRAYKREFYRLKKAKISGNKTD